MVNPYFPEALVWQFFSAECWSLPETQIAFVSRGGNENELTEPPLDCTAKSGKSHYSIYIGGGQKGPPSALACSTLRFHPGLRKINCYYQEHSEGKRLAYVTGSFFTRGDCPVLVSHPPSMLRLLNTCNNSQVVFWGSLPPCFVSPSASAEGVDLLPSDSLQCAQTHWLFRLYSLSTLIVLSKVVLLILQEFPTIYFDHIYPLPPPLHSHFLWTFKFLLASHQNSDTDKHKFWSAFLIRTIQIASNFGKTPCFLQLPKADETHKWDKWWPPAIQMPCWRSHYLCQ